MKHLLTFVAALFLAIPAFAQERLLPSQQPAASKTEADVPGVIHVTDDFLRLPSVQAGFEAYQRRLQETANVPHAAKTAEVYQIGETRKFLVINNERATGGTKLSEFDEIEFTLKAETDRFRLWVETAELNNGHVNDTHVEALREALQERTPPRSYNPNAGIIVNNQTLFGTPKDPDQDGKSDVLLVDVRDGWEPGEGYIAGFFWPGDILGDPNGTGGIYGNARDVLYIDTWPGLRSGDTEDVLVTAAHEYQHLIHFAYDEGELTFVDEGLSEWAEIANGYTGRSIRYLGKTQEHNQSFFDWRRDDLLLSLNDYERAGLFTTYFAERTSAEETGRLVQAVNPFNERARARGRDGYASILQAKGLTFEDVFTDFHIANFVNDVNLPPYGYTLEQRRTIPIVSSKTVDGSGSQGPMATNVTLQPGGVQYYTWENVHDATLTFGLNSGLLQTANPFTIDNMRNRLRYAVVLEPAGGARRVEKLPPGSHTFPGSYERITLVAVDVRPQDDTDRNNYARIDVRASWSTTGGTSIETIVYDDGQVQEGLFINMRANGQGAQATRFAVPAGNTRLSKVQIAPYYLNQFNNGGQPSDAPRDMTLKVWNVGPDGAPGEELFSLVVEDPRSYQGVQDYTLRFFEIDLREYAEQLSELPPVVFVGYTEAGSDANYMVVAGTHYEAENISYVVGPDGTWRRLWDVKFSDSGADEFPFQSTAIPVRAQFVTTAPVAAEDPLEVPGAITLEQNYPNPFNPTTAIRYTLPQAGPVRLSVYDVLGREVAMLIDGLQPAGIHEVQVDATNWSSGMYVYVLESEHLTLTKKMLLVK